MDLPNVKDNLNDSKPATDQKLANDIEDQSS